MKKLLAAAALALWLSGCGVKAPPRPPAVPVPPRPESLHTRVREGCVELAWKAPPAAQAANAAGEAVTAAGATVAAGAQTAARAASLAGVQLPLPTDHYEVLRSAEPAPGQEPVFTPAGVASGPSFRDCTAAPGGRYLYRVRAVAANGVLSEPGMPAAAIAGPAPAAPERLTATGGDGFVELSWKRPPGLAPEARFNIYRSTEAGSFPWRPVNSEPIAETRYSDGPLENGGRYYYEVRAAAAQSRGPAAESAAASAEAVPTDRVAPGAPQGLIASWSGKKVELRWFKNPEPDVVGYHVYRRTRGGKFVRLTAKPIADNTFTDGAVRTGRDYEYTVTAVDRAQPPNESEPSERQVVYTTP